MLKTSLAKTNMRISASFLDQESFSSKLKAMEQVGWQRDIFLDLYDERNSQWNFLPHHVVDQRASSASNEVIHVYHGLWQFLTHLVLPFSAHLRIQWAIIFCKNCSIWWQLRRTAASSGHFNGHFKLLLHIFLLSKSLVLDLHQCWPDLDA